MAAPPSTHHDQAQLERDARIYDYTKACNPDMMPVPHLALPAQHHEQGK